jgi:hypothetical protein
VPLVSKKIFRIKLFLTTSPPPFRSVYHFRGPKIFRTHKNFSRQYKFSRYHKITQFLTKLTEFVPFFFIISNFLKVNFFYQKTISRFSLTFCGISFFVCRQIHSFADNLFSGGCHTPHTPPFATALNMMLCMCIV